MPKFTFTDKFCDKIEVIVGRKFTRGGQKMMEDCIEIMESKIRDLEDKI